MLTKEQASRLKELAVEYADEVSSALLGKPDTQAETALHAYIDSLVCEPSSNAYQLPLGWRPVPVEPTPEMVSAVLATAHDEYGRDDPMNCLGWAESKSYVMAAIAAAPTPPVAAQSLRLPEPMTDAEIMELYRAVPKGYLSRDGHAGIRLARAIEAETLRRVKEANK